MITFTYGKLRLMKFHKLWNIVNHEKNDAENESVHENFESKSVFLFFCYTFNIYSLHFLGLIHSKSNDKMGGNLVFARDFHVFFICVFKI